jgi:hypothetical protein
MVTSAARCGIRADAERLRIHTASHHTSMRAPTGCRPFCEESEDAARYSDALVGVICERPRPTTSTKGGRMGFDQYHEPAEELSAETRTFARMIASLTEEAEAIGWYEQRMSLEPDAQARAIMANAQGEEFKHFGMDLEFLLRRTPNWRTALRVILFTEGDIVELGERAEAAEDR